MAYLREESFISLGWVVGRNVCSQEEVFGVVGELKGADHAPYRAGHAHRSSS